MKLKSLLPILVGGAAALIAMNYFNRKPAAKPRYFVVLADVPEHQAVKPDCIGTREWNDSQPMPADFITDRQMLQARFARRPIEKDSPLTETMLWPVGVDSLMMAKLRTEPDMRAVPVKVDDVTGGGGFVQPGNRVDVIATDSKRKAARTILQGVEVLAVNRSDRPGGEIEKKSKGNDVPRYVTLLLSLKQAEIIKASAAAREVTLNLLLGAENAEKVATSGANLNEILGIPLNEGEDRAKPAPVASIPAPAQRRPAAAQPAGLKVDHVVQVCRGNRSEFAEFRKAGGSWSQISEQEKREAEEKLARSDSGAAQCPDEAAPDSPPPPAGSAAHQAVAINYDVEGSAAESQQ